MFYMSECPRKLSSGIEGIGNKIGKESRKGRYRNGWTTKPRRNKLHTPRMIKQKSHSPHLAGRKQHAEMQEWQTSFSYKQTILV